jgi:predicted dehydrogenase
MSLARIAILSATGSGRKRTIPAVAKSNLCEVVAVHSRDEARASQLATEFQIPHYFTTERALLSSIDYDILYVASPPFLHKQQILEAIPFGKPIICEKPLALTVDDAMEIKGAVERSRLPFMIAHHLRHDPALQQVRKLLADGTIGPVRYASLQWSFKLNQDSANVAWKLDPLRGGSHAFFDAGIHAIDLAQFLFGSPVAVLATGFSAYSSNTLDNASALFGYPDKTASLNASQVMALPENGVRIDGENGRLVAPNALAERSLAEYTVTTGANSWTEKFSQLDLYQCEVEAFVRHVHGDPNWTGTSLEEGVNGVRILDAISRSIATGCVADLSRGQAVSNKRPPSTGR